MVDLTQFSAQIIGNPLCTTEEVLLRIALAKRRVQSVLDRELVAHQKTLEQKISDQGPRPQRVDPHLLGLAILDLSNLNRLTNHDHTASGTKSWYSNPGTSSENVAERLNKLGPLYAQISKGNFGNLIGDALEVVVFKCLNLIFSDNPRYSYQGYFHLDEPKNEHGRYKKTQPPKTIASQSTKKEADFLQFGHSAGPLCIECKNYREWIYPNHGIIRELIIKAHELGAIPVLIARRIHYTTITNLLTHAGIIAHETYYQYYPSEYEDLAAQVKHKKSLGFTDVTATEEPHPRTMKFFSGDLPNIVDTMAMRWRANEDALVAFAYDEINLAQLYTAIGSPAGGKWIDFEEGE